MVKYDLIFGLGPACSCSQVLRAASLQLLSFPYDWMSYMNQDRTLFPEMRMKVDHICQGMPDWFRKEDLVCDHDDPNPKGKCVYYNLRTKGIFIHDFPGGTSFDASYPVIAARYARRIQRLLQCLRSARSVLIVRLDPPPATPPPTSRDDCRYARQQLAEAFPNARFDVFHFKYEKGRSLEDAIEEQVEPGHTELTFDYHDYTPGKETYDVTRKAMARILSRRFAVRDYRTAGERIRGWLLLLRKLMKL